MKAQLKILTLAIAFAPAVVSQTTVVDFSSAGAMSSFNANGGLFTLDTATGGVGGSGSLSSTASNSALIYKTGISNTVGQTLTTSIEFKSSVMPTSLTISAGFAVSSTSYSPDNVQAYIYTSGDPQLRISSDTLFTTLGTAGNLGLSSSNWYRLQLSLTKNATSQNYDYSVSLNNLGTNGLSAASLVSSGTSTNVAGASSSTFSSAGTVYPWFGIGFSGGSPTVFIDNFTVASASAIPEPSTYAWVTGFAALALAAFRRKIWRRA